MVTITPNISDVRRADHDQSIESVCRGVGDGVTVRWNTSELDPDVLFDVACDNDLSSCRLRVRGPLSPVKVHCIAANDVGNKVHAWTLYASGSHPHTCLSPWKIMNSNEWFSLLRRCPKAVGWATGTD